MSVAAQCAIDPRDDILFLGGTVAETEIDFAKAIRQYESDEKAQDLTKHNHFYWRCIQGGLALVRKSPFEFDPIKEYWHCTVDIALHAPCATGMYRYNNMLLRRSKQIQNRRLGISLRCKKIPKVFSYISL